MKKRLDIQSLLENSQKQDLVLFLKNCFKNHPDLVDHFLIHFAAKFELDESEFQLIFHRIERLFPNNLPNLTHRKANQIKDHLKNLVEQARDCRSKEDYRQAFLIVSHILLLLDGYSDLIPEKFRFKAIQDRCFELMDGIYRESPAPELKSRMNAFLHQLIVEGKAIPQDKELNPYIILIEWGKDKPDVLVQKLIGYLRNKINNRPDLRHLWIALEVHILYKLDRQTELLTMVEEYEGEIHMYEAMHHHLKAQKLDKEIRKLLRTQYHQQKDRHTKSQIFKILRNQEEEAPEFLELAIHEYFRTGDVKILDNLLEEKRRPKDQLIEDISVYHQSNPEVEDFYLYIAYKYLEQDEKLKNSLMEEEDVYEILPFLDSVYPRFQKEIEHKLARLLESYLQTHFGRPALNHINGVLDELNRMGHHCLITFLIKNIQHQFGHRKHFQKLMKELVQ